MNKQILGWFLVVYFGMAMPGFSATTLCADYQKASGQQLRAAREKLHLSETTRDRVARELEALKQSGQADPGILQDYATYLQRVQDLVDENRRLVLKLEAVCTPEANRMTLPSGGKEASNPSWAAPGKDAVDDVTLLDRRLRESLASFDEMLLKRINAIQAESAEKMRDLAEQAAQAAGRAQQKTGMAAETEAASGRKNNQQGSQGQGQEQEASKQGQSASQEQKGAQSGASSGNGQSGSNQGSAARQGSGKAPSGAGTSTDAESPGTRTHSRDDDDIVARQLREAAEQESDPELKKKLWKEYEEYKKNTSR